MATRVKSFRVDYYQVGLLELLHRVNTRVEFQFKWLRGRGINLIIDWPRTKIRKQNIAIHVMCRARLVLVLREFLVSICLW